MATLERMLVHYDQAKRLLDEYPDGVPGYERVGFTLGDPNDDGISELTLDNGGHASVAAVAKAAGILEAGPLQASPTCIRQPAILGLANVGQIVTLDAGVWDDGDEDNALRAYGFGRGDASRPSTQIVWLYDGNENDPVQPQRGAALGRRQIVLPSAALGRTITVRVTRGRTTVYSEDFGPVEGGLTEYTFPAAPVQDADAVSADPGSRRRDGSSATARPPSKHATPRTDTDDKLNARGTGPKGKASAPKRSGAWGSKRDKLVEAGAEEKTPPPTADAVMEGPAAGS